MILFEPDISNVNVSKGQNVTIAKAKNHLPRLIHNSETEGIIPISRHGKVVAYLVSEKDFRKLIHATNDFSGRLENFRDKNSLTPEDIWKNVRSKEKGRKVSL